MEELLKKISAKEGAIKTLNPASYKAHGACSLDEPQPKFSLAKRIDDPLYLESFKTKSGFNALFSQFIPGTPTSKYLHESKR